ncbi:MAG: PhzF family phenazine biosynthesis protein [Gammaproteobacteria bacterium]|nr:PhzF family phenazine biosynthesis protein [Gammaproteobacteria bacterium]MDH5213418.1 PhzF family phenazine biosynthesis protein [Gammaproteobacteria bacterium]
MSSSSQAVAESHKGTLCRLSAFAKGSEGGNPARVWVGEELPDAPTMQAISRAVGFSETAFVAPLHGHGRVIRYYSPEAEVSFCGHATIATGVVLGRDGGEGIYRLSTTVGIVPVEVRKIDDEFIASLTSVEPRHKTLPEKVLNEVLWLLRWRPDDVDRSIPPAIGYAGAWHPIIAVKSADRLADLNYDFEALKVLMLKENLTTLQLIWREHETLIHSRNPFPVGGVGEDPATGASAAALGGYLRDAGLVKAPFRFLIRQGETMGRPSVLMVDVPATDGIVVSGSAIDIRD